MEHKRLVVLQNGHIVEEGFYNQQLNHFASILEKDGAKVVSKTKPAFNFDYGYIVSGFNGLTAEMNTMLIQANLKAVVKRLLRNTCSVHLQEVAVQ